jgi:hypothetical protein
LHTVVPFHGGELEVHLDGEHWTVRLGELEASSKRLDSALSALLDDHSPSIHALAAKLIEIMLVKAQAAQGVQAP